MSSAAGTPSAYAFCMWNASTRTSPLDAPSAPVEDARSSSPADVEAYYRDIAPFYDAELADRTDLPFWRRLAERYRQASVLEFGCGSGAVTEMLAPHARRLVGVDLSDDLLRQGRLRLAHWPQVSLLRADMRHLPLCRQAGAFDLVVGANDPFSHLTASGDRDDVLQAAADLLAPGGQLVLDALWLSPDEAAEVQSDGGRVQEHESTVDGQPLRVVERWRRDPQAHRCCEARYEYQVPGQRPVVAAFQARDWTVAELAQRFERAGLVELQRWGDYDGRPWHPTTSRQLIVAASRRA